MGVMPSSTSKPRDFSFRDPGPNVPTNEVDDVFRHYFKVVIAAAQLRHVPVPRLRILKQILFIRTAEGLPQNVVVVHGWRDTNTPPPPSTPFGQRSFVMR